MASIQARHTRACALSRPWTTFEQARRGCTCAGGPTYYVVVRAGRRLHRERVGKNKQQAERALRKIGTQVDEGEYRPQANIRFAEWGRQWLASLRRPKESTRYSYESTIAHATGVFGDRVVRALSLDDVGRFLAYLAELQLAPSTQAKHLRVLGACLQAAVRHGYGARNPVRELDKSEKPNLERRESAYFETEELPRLFAEMDEGLHRTVCLAALKTGMRQGELLALLWSDVDLQESVIRVRRTRSRGHVDTPKNRERRDVDLTPDVVDLLGAWWGECGSPGDDNLVFPGAGKDGYVEPTWLLRELYAVMAQACIPRVGPTGERRTFHSFRHTFAKRALESGRQITWLSRHLGHSTLSVTTDVYGHWERAARKAEVAQMAGVFGV
ncbi:MAG: site-specific integrase [Actinobacteria bacterium]|nr:site-specific integrase [Actinomycetota bacterium]